MLRIPSARLLLQTPPVVDDTNAAAISAARAHIPTSALILRASVDRLVAGGRVVLAAMGIVAIAIDSDITDGSRFVRLMLLGLYAALSLGHLVLASRTVRPRRAIVRLELIADSVFVAALTLLTGGRSATVFGLFVFVIVAAGVRRAPRAVVMTGIAYLSIFLGATVASNFVPGAGSLDLEQVVIRSLLLGLTAAVLVVFAVERDRLFDSLTTMATWPSAEWSDLEAAMFHLLGVAAEMAPGSRVALVWADADEPWTNVALLDDNVTITHLSPGDGTTPGPINAEESFIFTPAGDRESIVTRATMAGLVNAPGPLLSKDLLGALAPTSRSIVGVPAHGQIFSGHLLVLDLERIPSDFLLRAEIVARQISGSLDIWLLSRRAGELAAREERARVWRDLHDGVLQSLTGLALMLKRAEQMIDSSPVEARRLLDDASALVHDEQRDLRLSILEQKHAATSSGLPQDLPALVAQLARRFEQVWGLRIDVQVDAHIALGPAIAAQITRMIQEALSNSARHGQSTRVRLMVAETDDGLFITIEDNGRGFPFIGTFDYSALLEQRIGPVLLKDRIQRLQGTLDIRSARTGVGLDIRIPTRAGRLAG